MFYFVVKDRTLINIYDKRPSPAMLGEGMEVWEMPSIPEGVRVGYQMVNNTWVPPTPPPEPPRPDWQLFMDKLDVPERGGNGGYSEALNSPAKADAMQAYTICLMFVKNLGSERELLTLWYHLKQIMAVSPELSKKIMEAVTAANIPGDPS